jgi:FHS family Na+ dependent glucose MFS transporter 1
MQSASADKASLTEKTGQISKTLAYYTGFIALGMVAAVIGPSLPFLAAHTHTQLNEISFLFTARALGYLLGSLQGGRLYDRLPGHPILVVMLCSMAIMMALVPLIPLLWLLAAVMLVLGMAEGAFDVGCNILLVWVHGRRVGPFMNGLHFFFGFGAFLAPVIIAQTILMTGDISWGYWGIALLMLPISVWLLRLPSPPDRRASEERRAGPADPLLIALIAAFFFLYAGAEVSYGGWIFTYTTALGLAEGPAAAAQAAYLTSAFWLSLTLGRLLSIPIAARFRPRIILLGDLLGCLASIGLILIGPDTLPTVWVGTIGSGLFMASIFPTTISLAERRMAITGQITRWFFVGSGAGAMFMPWLIGQLFESIGPQITMLGILVELAIALLIFAWITSYSRRSKP